VSWQDDELTIELESEPTVILGDSPDFALEAVNDSLHIEESLSFGKNNGDLSQTSNESKIQLIAVTISIFAHVTLGSLVLNSRLSLESEPNPDFLEIQLIPKNPLLEKVEEILEPKELVEEELIEEVAEVEEIPESELIEQVIKNISPDLVEVAEQEVTDISNEPQAAEEAIESPEVFLPSIVNIRDALDAIEDDDAARLWTHDCDFIKENSELHICNPTDWRNYKFVELNSFYANLNPIRELSRGVHTLRTVTSNTHVLTGRLQSANLPSGLSDYVLEQVEAGITFNTNSGNLAIENINIMTQSAVAATARAIMNDPWVVNRAKELRQRNVHAQ